MHAKVNTSAGTLLEACGHEEENMVIVNKDTIRSEVKFINSSWQNLSDKLMDLKQHVINVEEELVIFNDQQRQLEDTLDIVDSELSKQRLVSAVPDKCLQSQKNIKVRVAGYLFSEVC